MAEIAAGSRTGDDTSRGIILIVVAMIVFASQDAVIKLLAQTYPIAQIMWVRSILFAAFALAIARRKRPLRECLKSARPQLQVVRALMLLGDMALFVLAVALMPLADAHALIATFPLIATALAALVLKEHVGIRRWAAVGVCFVGVLIILRPGLTALQPGALAALGAAIFFAFYNIMTRMVSRTDTGETSLLYVGVVGLVATTAVGPFFWVPPTGQAWLYFAIIAAAGTLAHFLLIKALEAAPASVLQPFNYVLLLWATIVGFIVFGQFPDRWTVVGAALIVASGLYTIYRERKRRPARTATA